MEMELKFLTAVGGNAHAEVDSLPSVAVSVETGQQ